MGAARKKEPGGCLLSRDGPSIIGEWGLDFRVRHGNGYFPPSVAAGRCVRCNISLSGPSRGASPARGVRYGQASRPVSTARLCASPRLHLRPIYRMFSPGPSAGARAPVGPLVSGRASRLDALSGYPFPAWLPCRAPGGTTGAPEAGPPRSSRTKGGPPQGSIARNR